ncbi:alanine--tRNA ligase [Chengkuizengella axinellae]|uniref:Alanine--tRNA ligase n=1 Tax=Chengkuizengella axinellae TaxID=3064388 RepID=A0ABT9IVJ4_9BACL|nr:alanine--tRNA ligase [Chengkuizengella sp. 2205SS18-9]MDP5272805.1 alanine--tRNA ligase [Chengkuizengella sp. 2205SS18-9]
MKSGEIRQKWLDFFATKGHKIEESASLVPHNDPSLLWINAGMAPLKRYFDGTMKPDNPRIANAQKCIRTNDIENVGKTKRHHTMFEMLGNFSIGDYFKEETITWAWEFLTDKKWIGFDPERLSVTVHFEDEEAYKIWNDKIGVPEERIYKLDKDNFWDIGEGPCGPCTEIFYDRGDVYGDLSDPEVNPAGENERFLEVWNLVFSQFNHNKDGSYTPLPNKNIDTGAGLERFATLLQDVDSTFDTDLFLPTILETANIANVKYKENAEHDIALKVIADHIRTVAFAIGDGVLPSNEGRGYVIRRLLRRAVRYGKVLGVNEPFLYRLVPVVGSIMGHYYKAVVEKQQFIEKIIRVEEERFHETLSDGLHILSEMIQEANKNGISKITGDQAFKLYDTYGFPLDLTEDFAQENGFTVDQDGFEQAMQEQRERARAARQEVDSMKVQGGPLTDLEVKSEFVGYNNLEIQAKIEAIILDDQLVDLVSENNSCLVVLDQTPFYAESGGQVSDHGFIETDSFKGIVQDVFKAPNGQHVHTVQVESGTMKVGDQVKASVAREMREDIIKNHTATHLLHKALKEVLGDHVNQAGSLVAPERMRFDFSHFGSISEEELTQIEQKVNAQIWKNTSLNIEQKSLTEAKAMGAMALFGEKYGDTVRVVQVGDYSIELCGGCHVNQTSQIGLFKIVSENGIGSGIRRIEAVTGQHAYQFLSSQLELLDQSAQLLKSKIDDVPKRLELLLTQNKELARENESLRGKLNTIEAGSLTDQVKQIGNVPVLVAQLKQVNIDTMRSMIDELKEKLKSVVIVFGTANDGKVQLASAVTPDLVKQGYHAGKIIKEVAAICGGGGGGRPDMAQAGGKDPSKLNQALDSVESYIEQFQNK